MSSAWSCAVLPVCVRCMVAEALRSRGLTLRGAKAGVEGAESSGALSSSEADPTLTLCGRPPDEPLVLRSIIAPVLRLALRVNGDTGTGGSGCAEGFKSEATGES